MSSDENVNIIASVPCIIISESSRLRLVEENYASGWHQFLKIGGGIE